MDKGNQLYSLVSNYTLLSLLRKLHWSVLVWYTRIFVDDIFKFFNFMMDIILFVSFNTRRRCCVPSGRIISISYFTLIQIQMKNIIKMVKRVRYIITSLSSFLYHTEIQGKYSCSVYWSSFNKEGLGSVLLRNINAGWL